MSNRGAPLCLPAVGRGGPWSVGKKLISNQMEAQMKHRIKAAIETIQTFFNDPIGFLIAWLETLDGTVVIHTPITEAKAILKTQE